MPRHALLKQRLQTTPVHKHETENRQIRVAKEIECALVFCEKRAGPLPLCLYGSFYVSLYVWKHERTGRKCRVPVNESIRSCKCTHRSLLQTICTAPRTQPHHHVAGAHAPFSYTQNPSHVVSTRPLAAKNHGQQVLVHVCQQRLEIMSKRLLIHLPLVTNTLAIIAFPLSRRAISCVC